MLFYGKAAEQCQNPRITAASHSVKPRLRDRGRTVKIHQSKRNDTNRRTSIMNKIETVKLNNGVEMPLEGFGVFQALLI